MNTENSYHQQLMDKAYDRYEKLSKEDFWDQLDAEERVAVAIGNMNYQIENGGFIQWFDNRYATKETIKFIKRVLNHINQKTCLQVIDLIKRFEAILPDLEEMAEDGECEDAYTFTECLDKDYYKINDAFMEEVEQALKDGSWKPKQSVATP